MVISTENIYTKGQHRRWHMAKCCMTQFFFEIFAIEFQLDIWNETMSNVNIPIESQYATSYLLAIAIFCPECHHLRDIQSKFA